MHKEVVRLFIKLATEALLHGFMAHLLLLELLDALSEVHDAVLERVTLISLVLSTAPLASLFGEAGLVLVVADLMARTLHLLTSVARDDFMRASLPMRAYFKNMHLFAALILALFDYFRARFLQMLIDHVDSQRCLTT